MEPFLQSSGAGDCRFSDGGTRSRIGNVSISRRIWKSMVPHTFSDWPKAKNLIGKKIDTRKQNFHEGQWGALSKLFEGGKKKRQPPPTCIKYNAIPAPRPPLILKIIFLEGGGGAAEIPRGGHKCFVYEGVEIILFKSDTLTYFITFTLNV